ncbi:MAG: alkaline phosphatase family protein [Acidobacteriota bacterium]
MTAPLARAARGLSAAGLAVVALAAAGPSAPAAARLQPARPSLVVVLVVDQLPTEYLTRYERFWRSGMRRLLTEGAVFTEAAYPYLNTVTCVGHATIATGALPYAHGIVHNEWWRRDEQQRRPCTHDATVASVPYRGGPAEKVGHSAARLRMPTLGDRLRQANPASRVVTLSMKPRSAAMLAGPSGTTVTWFSDADAWSTSTAFAPSRTPDPDVEALLTADDLERERGSVWTRRLDLSAYEGPDDVPWERPEPGWTAAFPHPLAGAPGTPREQFYTLWMGSPYSDAHLGRLAEGLVRRLALGQRGAVDFLGVSFSATDYVGHDFGPDSHEVQDTLARLDAVLGALLAALDAQLGRGGYVVALSSDHGVAPVPERRIALGAPAGRLLARDLRRVVDESLAAAAPGPHVAHVETTDVYLTDASRALVAARPALMEATLAALGRLPGVERALAGPPLAGARESVDPLVRAAALSYVPGESGDIIVAPVEHWILSGTSGTTHGTHHAYDQRVPVIFLGAPFRAGRYSDPASPADIHPTLAAVAGLPVPEVDGRVLRSALR